MKVRDRYHQNVQRTQLVNDAVGKLRNEATPRIFADLLIAFREACDSQQTTFNCRRESAPEPLLLRLEKRDRIIELGRCGREKTKLHADLYLAKTSSAGIDSISPRSCASTRASAS